jgi:hypothetical protein
VEDTLFTLLWSGILYMGVGNGFGKGLFCDCTYWLCSGQSILLFTMFIKYMLNQSLKILLNI